MNKQQHRVRELIANLNGTIWELQNIDLNAIAFWNDDLDKCSDKLLEILDSSVLKNYIEDIDK